MWDNLKTITSRPLRPERLCLVAVLEVRRLIYGKLPVAFKIMKSHHQEEQTNCVWEEQDAEDASN